MMTLTMKLNLFFAGLVYRRLAAQTMDNQPIPHRPLLPGPVLCLRQKGADICQNDFHVEDVLLNYASDVPCMACFNALFGVWGGGRRRMHCSRQTSLSIRVKKSCP